MNEEEVEKRSLEDLDRIINAARELGVSLVLIGGYAVAAYTRGYRYTKDIDLVADKLTIGELKGVLKALGYSIRDTEFGLAGAKNLDGGFIDLHISVGKITDISTGKDYPVNSDLFKNAKRLDVKGYRTNASLKAAVVELETLIVLKLMTVGRDKDAVDLISLIDIWQTRSGKPRTTAMFVSVPRTPRTAGTAKWAFQDSTAVITAYTGL